VPEDTDDCHPTTAAALIGLCLSRPVDRRPGFRPATTAPLEHRLRRRAPSPPLEISPPNRLTPAINSPRCSSLHHASPRPSHSPPRAFPAPPPIAGTTPLRRHRRSASARHHSPRWVGESIPLGRHRPPSAEAAPASLPCSGWGGGEEGRFCPKPPSLSFYSEPLSNYIHSLSLLLQNNP
jgi:hypothetical protein